MATDYGFTEAGWRTPTWAELRRDVASYVRARLGESIRTDRESVVGKLVDVGAYIARGVYEGIGAIQTQLDPSQATGTYLDAQAQLFGTARLAAAASYVDLTITAPEGTVIPAGTQVRLTSGDGTPWTSSAAATVGTGDTEVDVRFTCSVTGPREAAAASEWEFVGTFTGWEDVTDLDNAADAAVGRSLETDAALRTRLLSTQVPGPTTAGIRAGILAVTGVTNCSVTANRTELTVDTIPPGAFEAVVWPESASLEDGIAEALWTYSPATGPGSFGSVTRTVTDSEGAEVDVSWTWGTSVAIDVIAGVTRTAAAPSDWSAQVDAALDAYLASLSPGDDVSWVKMSAAVSGFPWVSTATVNIRKGLDSFASNNIAIGSRELAVPGSYTIA